MHSAPGKNSKQLKRKRLFKPSRRSIKKAKMYSHRQELLENDKERTAICEIRVEKLIFTEQNCLRRFGMQVMLNQLLQKSKELILYKTLNITVNVTLKLKHLLSDSKCDQFSKNHYSRIDPLRKLMLHLLYDAQYKFVNIRYNVLIQV